MQASSGEDLIGLMNPTGRPIHIAKEEDKKKIPEIADFFIDLCMPAEEVKKKVRLSAIPSPSFQEFSEIGECISGKCLDNRITRDLSQLEAMRKAKSIKYDVIFAATVQEEVGCRGHAGPAAYSAAARHCHRDRQHALRGHTRRAGG